MDETEALPGPWTFQRAGASHLFRIVGADGRNIAYTNGASLTIEHEEATARLIAAAPEMLDALEDAREMLEDEGVGSDRVENAIAKAAGGEGYKSDTDRRKMARMVAMAPDMRDALVEIVVSAAEKDHDCLLAALIDARRLLTQVL